MEQDKRKRRALILLLFALFCTAGATYFALDGKRFGGSFFTSEKDKDKDDKAAAAAAGAGGGRPAGGGGVLASVPEAQFMGQETPLQQEVALVSVRHRNADVGGSSSSFNGKSEDDLFKLGDPAAGIASGKFVVAQNDTPSTPAEQLGVPAGPGATFARPDVVSNAAAPTGNGGPPGDGVLRTAGSGSETPAAPVPEASSLTMIALGVLCLAVAAGRRRRGA